MNYTIKNNEAFIASYEGQELYVEVPEKIEGCPVVELLPYAFSKTEIKEIRLPSSVKKIGKYSFYNCKNLEKITLYNTMTDLGAGAFTGCHKVANIEITFINNHKSILREILIELAEPQNVVMHMQDGKAKLYFPEYFEEAVENTPARILETHTHGSGMLYRNCFIQRSLDFKLYDERFEYAKAWESKDHVLTLVLNRLLYPYALGDASKKKYEQYLNENAEYCIDFAAKNNKSELFYYYMEHCNITADVLDFMINSANKYGRNELISFLMEEKRKKFGIRRKKFEL